MEYYTRLSLLETDTANLNITDANGLNRFKSGFFVDNFKKHASHQIDHPRFFSASTDAKRGYLRPGHYTTCLRFNCWIKIIYWYWYNCKSNFRYQSFEMILMEIILKKLVVYLTMDYTETEMLKQIYASRVENVNPFLIVYYSGDMTISPDSDIWMDTKRVDASITYETAAYNNAIEQLGINEQTGFSES